ncbi:MAG: hypothetical protein PHE51_03460 [Eubacteriales bacterium]|nr:hypothetical protein [Eubacteriales bacterium]
MAQGDYENTVVPTYVTNYTNDTFIDVEAVTSCTCAVKTDGSVIGFGANTNNCLGAEVGTNTNVPVVISGLSNIQTIGYGVHHGIALSNDNNVYLWGRDNYGQLCSTAQKTEVTDLSGVQMVAAGRNHNVVLTVRKVYAWGDNTYGQVDNGDVLLVSTLETQPSIQYQTILHL